MTPQPAKPPSGSALVGTNVLLMGPTGTGKNHSIGTLVDHGVEAGFEVFLQALEPGYESTLGYWTDRDLPIPPNFHWNHLQFIQGGLESLMKKVEDIGRLSQDALYTIKDATRGQRNYVHQLLKQMANFEDQRTGQSYGNVSKWGTDRVYVLDGLTGLGRMAMALTVGSKPVRSQNDWGIAQDIVEPILWQLCEGFRCHFVLLAHVERETDVVSGSSKIMVSSLGKALPPKVAPLFSDAIMTVRSGAEWWWTTADGRADLKTRNLPISDKIEPDFSQIMRTWEKRGGRYVP